jgi:hypothetical protein
LAEEREVCGGCDQPLAECRDRANSGTYSVVQETCWACVPMQAVMHDEADSGKSRGRYYGVRRNT